MTGLAGIDMRPVITLKCVKPLGHELWRVTHVTACEHKKHTNASYAIGFICEKKNALFGPTMADKGLYGKMLLILGEK